MTSTRVGITFVGLALFAAACTSSTSPAETTIEAASDDTAAVTSPQLTVAEQVYESVAS